MALHFPLLSFTGEDNHIGGQGGGGKKPGGRLKKRGGGRGKVEKREMKEKGAGHMGMYIAYKSKLCLEQFAAAGVGK